jgi:hypothetical protein
MWNRLVHNVFHILVEKNGIDINPMLSREPEMSPSCGSSLGAVTDFGDKINLICSPLLLCYKQTIEDNGFDTEIEFS